MLDDGEVAWHGVIAEKEDLMHPRVAQILDLLKPPSERKAFLGMFAFSEISFLADGFIGLLDFPKALGGKIGEFLGKSF